MRLDEEGLVEVFPAYETVVSRVDVDFAQRRISCAKRWNWRSCACWRCSQTPHLNVELNAAIARQQQFAKAGEFEKFMAADNEFHARLYEAADKQDIWTLVRSRSGHIDRLRRLHLPSPGKAQDIVRHHKLIAKAIAEGNPEEAQKHLRAHLSGTLSELAKIRVAASAISSATRLRSDSLRGFDIPANHRGRSAILQASIRQQTDTTSGYDYCHDRTEPS